MKISSYVQLLDSISGSEALIVDVLCQFIRTELPYYCNEKISYNVPFFYGNKGLCIVWPASIPRGGIQEGVLLGFWYGCLLRDEACYLDKGTNKQIYYKVFKSTDEFDLVKIKRLLNEAIELDRRWSK